MAVLSTTTMSFYMAPEKYISGLQVW